MLIEEGNSSHKTGDLNGLRRFFDSLLCQDPQNPEMHNDLGVNLAELVESGACMPPFPEGDISLPWSQRCSVHLIIFGGLQCNVSGERYGLVPLIIQNFKKECVIPLDDAHWEVGTQNTKDVQKTTRCHLGAKGRKDPLSSIDCSVRATSMKGSIHVER